MGDMEEKEEKKKEDLFLAMEKKYKYSSFNDYMSSNILSFKAYSNKLIYNNKKDYVITIPINKINSCQGYFPDLIFLDDCNFSINSNNDIIYKNGIKTKTITNKLNNHDTKNYRQYNNVCKYNKPNFNANFISDFKGTKEHQLAKNLDTKEYHPCMIEGEIRFIIFTYIIILS